MFVLEIICVGIFDIDQIDQVIFTHCCKLFLMIELNWLESPLLKGNCSLSGAMQNRDVVLLLMLESGMQFIEGSRCEVDDFVILRKRWFEVVSLDLEHGSLFDLRLKDLEYQPTLLINRDFSTNGNTHCDRSLSLGRLCDLKHKNISI